MSKRRGQFEGKGLGTKYKQKPLSVMISADKDEIVRSLPNRSEFIRQAIDEKLERDGLLQVAS